jgi:Ran GTPase-activating protein (RanGAP) involved in mRNA processing and transport
MFSLLAIKEICNAMITNTSIKVLELKGNNIHGEGTNSLAKLLRHNITIKRFFFISLILKQPFFHSNFFFVNLNSLSLEWNSLGLMDTHAFPTFCECLALNKSLIDIDLKNNQITHTSAIELCSALEKNTIIRTLGKN